MRKEHGHSRPHKRHMSPLTLAGEVVARLREGVVRLNGRGKIRTLNAGARPWVRCLAAQHGRVMEWVAEAQQGTLALPAKLPLFEDCADTPKPFQEVWLDRDGAGYVLVILPVTEQGAGGEMSRDESLADDFTQLMGAQVLDEMETMRTLLDKFGQGSLSPDAMTQQAANLSALLGEMSDLAELRQRDLVFADERFAPGAVLGEVLPGLPRQTGPDAVSYAVQEIFGVGQIYGDRAWIRRALETLLGRMGEGCPPGYRVQLALRQIGDYVILSANVVVDRTHGNAAHLGTGLPLPASPVGFGLRMQVCKRIIKLHGGVLKLVMGDPVPGWPADLLPIESFNLSLPTGLPVEDRSRVSCSSCRVTNQAMEYARDLAELMSRPSPVDNSMIQPAQTDLSPSIQK